jgi:hypothetical protein
MTRVAAVLLDLLILAVFAVLLLLVVTGGGVYYVGGIRIRARSVDNPVLMLSALVVLRYTLRQWTASGTANRVDSWIDTGVTLVTERIPSGITRLFGKPVAALALVAAATFVTKVLLAWSSPGFFSGDDVEIHEMSLGALLGKDWPVWKLRSAFFPLTFVYPAQWIAHSLGAIGPDTLVLAGRASVALLSTAAIPLTWLAARRLVPAEPLIAAFAVLFLAINKLFISFGSSELPRPVSTVFVLAAFLFFLRRERAVAAASGVLLGIAVAFRFSEIVFVASAVLLLILSRDWTRVVILGGAAVLCAAAITALADALYWGTPLSSVATAIDYTLVQRRSSRGYEAPWEYLGILPYWSTPLFVGLALVGTSRRHADSWWLWTPIALLSLLPHKEGRYLVPVIPFLSIAAARGLVRAIAWLDQPASTGGRRWARELFAPLLLLSVLHEVGGWRLARSNEGIRLARHLRAAEGDGVAAEDFWKLGGAIYLSPRDPLLSLDAALLADSGTAAAAVADKSWVALRISSAASGADALMQSLGFARDPSWHGEEYVLYRRGPPAGAAPAASAAPARSG